MTRVVLSALLSHWWRQPLQLMTLLAGLAMATSLWTGVQAINAEARASYQRAATVLDEADRPSLRAPSGEIATADFALLRRAGWPVAPLIEGTLHVEGGQDIRVLGIDLTSAGLTRQRSSSPVGTTGTAKGGGVLSRALTEALSAALAAGPAADDAPDTRAFTDSLAALFDPGTGFGTPETLAALTGPAGLAGASGDAGANASASLPRLVPSDAAPPRTLITDIVVADRLLRGGGTGGPIDLSRLVLTGPPPARALDGLTDLPADLGLRLTPAEGGSGGDIGRLTESFHLNLTAFGLLSFAVGLFIVHAAIGLAFEQRRPALRTLRAMGVPVGRLMLALLAELLVLGLLAGAAGVALGYVIAALLLPDVAATLQGLYGAQIEDSLQFHPFWAATGLGMALAGTLIAAAQALWQVRRLPLLAAAQPRAWLRASTGRLKWQAWCGFALLGAAGWLALRADGVMQGFAALGCLLLGAALMLPGGIAALLALAERLSPPPLRAWFWADTRQQLPGLSLALMALLLALATNIGVGTMVSSFRLTFTGWLDQRLAAELYVSARTPEEADRLTGWLAPRVDAVLPIWKAQTRIAGAPTEIYSVADHATYRDNWPVLDALPDAWDLVAGGRAAMINEQMSRSRGLRPGARIQAGPLGNLQVAGVYSDYGNTRAQILVSPDRLTQAFPDVQRLRFGLRLPPDRVEALIAALVDDFGLPRDAIRDQAAIKALSLGIFERTFTVTAALNLLTLAVAGFAILTSLLSLSVMRLPQLAPVWALGVTRRRLAWLELARSLMLAALTYLIALPVGLLLAWVLLAVVNVAAFGWRLPMSLFPQDWLRLFALAMLAALLASALPLWRLSRRPPSGFLKVFANER
ncbi:FtsX-like permease family protein [Brevirhabdus sp.]|uniref:FtsX-like permease family protein n=1 Tax=Brevirhabdus sp. TaxID=2004514 RepID=UPI004058E6DA